MRATEIVCIIDCKNRNELGEYISALSNSAAIEGRKFAYFVWGINDKTHEVVGTAFNYDQDVNHEPLKHYLRRKCSPDNNFDFKELTIRGKRIVLLTIPAAKTVPLSFAWERYIRIGSSKENFTKIPGKRVLPVRCTQVWASHTGKYTVRISGSDV